MAHVGTLRDFHFGKDVDDIRGASIYGPDDSKLGKVDDIIFNHANGAVEYLVVDTGGWLSSRQFLVPADRVENRPNDPRDLRCDFTKEQIERMPAYDEKMTETDASWGDYEGRYRESVSSGGVLHREGSDHLITPEADEQPAATGSGNVDFTPTRMADKFNTPAGDPSKIRMRPAGTASRAEDSAVAGNALGSERAAWTEGEVARSASDVMPSAAPARSREMSGAGEFTGESAYGNPGAQATPPLSTADPAAFRQRTGDPAIAPGSGPYPTVTRCQRLRDFEEHLRRNRVDVTASCQSCGVQRDKAA